MRGDVRGWRWRKPGGRERSREPGLDAALRRSCCRGGLAAEDARSALEGQRWAAHETPLSCQVQAGAARPGVWQRDLGERQVSTLATGPRWEEMEPIRELFRGRKERRGPRVKPQKPEGLKPSYRARQKARKLPRACDNLDPLQEIVWESRQRALSAVTCVCILTPPLQFTCLWVRYLAFLTLAVTLGGIRCCAVLSTFHWVPGL